MSWLQYLVEANIYLGVFYLFYCLYLNRETHYTLNRVYLLFSCVVSFIIPLLQIGLLKPVETVVQSTVSIIPGNIVYSTASPIQNGAETSHFTLQDGLLYGYVLGVAIFMFLMAVKLYKLFRLSRAESVVNADGYKLVYLNDSNAAFSFFHYLFIGTQAPGSETIIKHELVHIRQKHSVDIVLLELFKIINWFNPFIYLLQNSLKTVHEYIADEQTAAHDGDTLVYSSFLVDNAYGISGSSITHSFFNYNLLKKRIIMLNQQRSGSLARLKYLMLAPLCTGLLCVSTLAFSKTYGWVDLAPSKQKSNYVTISLPVKHLQTVPEETNVRPEKSAANQKNSVNRQSSTRLVTDNTNNSVVDENSDNGITGYVIDPNSFDGPSLFRISSKLYKKGYKMDFDESKNSDGEPLLSISIKPQPGTGWEGNRFASASFRLNEMKKSGNIIYVGANKALKRLYIRSDKKDLMGQKALDKPDVELKGAQNKGESINPDTSKDVFEAFYKQIAQKTHYPRDARDKNYAGRVIAGFTVDAENKIQDVRIYRGASESINTEVVRVLQACDASMLKPGKYAFPVAFAITGKDGKYTGNMQDPTTYVNKYAPSQNDGKNNENRKVLNEVVIVSYSNL